MAARGLSPKQISFVDHYLRTSNGVKSAELAGYGGTYNSRAVHAHWLLNNPKVINYMAEIMSPEEVQEELSKVARTNEFSVYPSKVRALELMGKIHGLLTEKLAISLDRQQLERAIAEQIGRLAEGQGQSTEPAQLTAADTEGLE